MAATPNPYLHVQQRKHLDFFNWMLFAKVAKFMAGRRISLHLPCCQKTDLAQVSFLLFVFRGLSKGLCLWDCGLCVIGMSFCLPMCVGLFLFDILLEFEYLSLSLYASVFVFVCLCGWLALAAVPCVRVTLTCYAIKRTQRTAQRILLQSIHRSELLPQLLPSDFSWFSDNPTCNSVTDTA